LHLITFAPLREIFLVTDIFDLFADNKSLAEQYLFKPFQLIEQYKNNLK